MIVSAAAVFLVGWLPALIPPVYPLIAAAIIAVLARRNAVSALYLPALFLAGIGYGNLWGQQLLDQRLPPAMESIDLQARISVLEPPRQRRFSGGGQRQRFAARILLESCPESVPGCRRELGRVLLAYYGEQSIRAGDLWRGRVKLKRPRGLANPGSFNYESWLASHRFAATGYIRSGPLQRLGAGRASPHQRWRQLIADQLAGQALDADVRGVLLALSNGDRSGLGHALWSRLQQYGLNHLVVISGLHVGLVAGIGFLLGRLAGRRCAHLSAAALALIYSALAGFALPTVRALAMLASVQLAALAGRRVRPWRSLSLALLLVALLEPLATHGAGFWLSFAAVALIFYVQGMHPDLPAWRLTLLLQFALSLAMGLVASYWFGGFGWLAPLANLVAVPVLTFWLAPLCLCAGLMALLWPAAASLCWQLAALPVSGFLALDETLAAGNLPLWLDYRPGLAAQLSLLAACLLLLARRGWPQRRLAPLFLLAALFPARPAGFPGELEFWLLDVGQGLAAVALAGDRVLVVDTGAGDPAGPNMATTVIAPFLEGRGIDGIDILVLSHSDRDHAGGVYSLHDRFSVGETWYGEAPFPGLPRQRACRAGAAERLGPLLLEVLSPEGDGAGGNNQSCVMRLSFQGARLLLPGDIDADLERHLVRRSREQLAAAVLVSPHHGSRSSSSSAFLAAVRPALVLLSRGYHNRFGHPHPVVLERYRRLGLELCDTAEQGALQIRLGQGRILGVSGWRRQRRFYWHGAASPACAPAYNDAL